MSTHTLPEALDRLERPIYRPYAIARDLLRPGMSVLDVGCGNAKVSEFLGESGATIDGIEPDLARAAQAQGRIRHVSTVPAGEPDDSLTPPYDMVTFFDVLEHLSDPGAALAWAASMVGRNGLLLASIPNSAHISFRWKIARGDWSMRDWGLFDRTHIRFFDTNTMKQLRPQGTVLQQAHFSTPGMDRGWRRLLLERRPALFALHGMLVWQRQG